MSQRIDEKGKTYGRLRVIGMAARQGKYGTMWTCECTCGTIKDVNGHHLRNGDAKSCGCRRREPHRRSAFCRGNKLDYIDDDILIGS